MRSGPKYHLLPRCAHHSVVQQRPGRWHVPASDGSWLCCEGVEEMEGAAEVKGAEKNGSGAVHAGSEKGAVEAVSSDVEAK